MNPPDYAGGGLVNLVAELEGRLGGSAPSAGLYADLASAIPEASSYVLVLMDGLGDHQLDHPAARALADSRRGAINASFPTTTTVNLATIATGLPPVAHGLIAYQLWLPEADQVINTIKWTTLWGDPVPHDYGGFLPSPNMWERLAAVGIEPIVVQPYNFENTPLSQVLYRGCRWEPWTTTEEAATAAAQLAAEPGRYILLYLPHVDFAAHVSGQDSEEYQQAIKIVAATWELLCRNLPAGAAAIATADHGHVDVPPARQVRIAKPDHKSRTFYGDGRALFVRGDGAELAARLPATWVPLAGMHGWWGDAPPHPRFEERAPDGALIADEGHIVLHRFGDDRLVGHHGGLTAKEVRVPLLVAEG
jgi:hypothetical protein